MSSSIRGFPLQRASRRILFWRRLLFASTSLPSIPTTQRCSYSLRSFTKEEYGPDEGDSQSNSSGARRRTNVTPVGVPRRIHILGFGSLGKLVAYHLAGIPNRPPISLLFHRTSTRDEWIQNGKGVEVERFGETDRRTGFDHESALPANSGFQRQAESIKKPIHNLIVTLKAPMTTPAISSIAHRLAPNSTIVFLQNGMGVIDELNEKVFPDPDKRPRYMVGIVTHGVYSKTKFQVVHAGQGTIALSVIPTVPFEKDYTPNSDVLLLPHSSRYLLRTLTRTPTLAAIAYPPQELFQLQLEKLAINAVVNPLTAILGCHNGDLLGGSHATRIMRVLLAEISLVLRNLPELQGLSNIESRYSSERLEYLVIDVLRITARNVSSMLQDVRNGQITEIKYINGWIVNKGEDLGFRCIVNYAIMQLLETKSWLTSIKDTDKLPFEEPK